jgi:hypothetical protein
MRPAPGQIIDFYQDWGSARNHRIGFAIYAPHSISIPQHLGLPSNSSPGINYNAHPPTAVLLALPLTPLEFQDAALAWNIISLAAFLTSVLIVGEVLSVPAKLSLPIFALLPFCVPVLGNLQMGQLTPILVLLITTTWALERSGRSISAAVLLAVATTIKLFPAYLLTYYIARRSFQSLLAAGLSFLVLTLTTAAILGPGSYHDYLHVVLPHLSDFVGWGYNCSIAGFWHKLFDPAAEIRPLSPFQPSLNLARWGTLLTNLTITAAIAQLAFRARGLVQRDLAFAAAITAMLLVSPVTWDISLLLLLVPITVVARSVMQSRSTCMSAILALIIPIIWLPQMLMMKLFSPPLHSMSLAYILGPLSLKLYALLAILTLNFALFRTTPRLDPPLSHPERVRHTSGGISCP